MYRVKQFQFFCILVAFVLSGVTTSPSATAHGGRFNRFNFGIHLGYPGYYGYGYYDPFFYSPAFYPPPVLPLAPAVTMPYTPPVYIQQQEQATTPQLQSNDWYYCQEKDGYYPYVKQCPSGWLRVDPQPDSQ